MVAARQIGSANAAPENGIAHQYLLADFVDENHMSGRMPRYKSHLQFRCANGNDIAVGQIVGRQGRWGVFEVPQCGHGFGAIDHYNVGRMQIIRQIIDLFHPPVAKDVVDVGVGAQQ